MPPLPWTRINDFLLEVCSAKELDDFNSRVCSHVSDLVPHDFPIFCVSSNRADLQRLANGEDPDKLIDPSIRALAGDPGTVAAWNRYFRFRLPINDGYFASSLVSDFRPFADTEFVTDFVRPRSVDLCLGGWFRRYTVVIPRCRPARAYTDQEIAVSRIIAPHLENHYTLLSLSRANRESFRSRSMRGEASRLGLTRREQEVALLLVERLSMPEIAERLFVSSRTVETHVQHIYAKLGIGKKRELGEYLLGRRKTSV